MATVTLAYTPGNSGRAQPTPQLTTPTSVCRLFSSRMRGPPESPWHESFPGAAAQSIASFIFSLYGRGAALQAALLITVTFTSCKIAGTWLPAPNDPQPVTVATSPVNVVAVCRRRLREHVVGTSVSLPRGLSTRETDSTHISQLKTPHLDKLIESKWARGQGAARGWTESWQGAERRELR